MSRHIDLGSFVDTNKRFHADLDIILRSNVLLQANSGGGKSWTLRRMIEQSFGRVPQIIIDPEGEFSTLRQKFDLVLVGKGGDTPADLRSAQLLAHRLLELGTSAVVDLFEMSKMNRPVWVAAFVQALVDAPKKLWRDLLLYVDEAHELAPEAGHGAHESAAEKQCRHALIDMAAKGRKRGYGVVAATQRLGKLSKDFAAELKNVLIGQTFIDIDRERAAGSLGIAKANKAQFFIDVKTLQPGAFYSLGRAFTLEPTPVTIGEVQTEHPEAGRRQSAPPPPTEKIRHLLPQLADLPKEAETKIATEKELKARIAELEREVRSAVKVEAHRLPPPAKVVEKYVVKAVDIARIEKLVHRLQKGHGVLAEILATQRGMIVESEQKLAVAVGNLALQVNQAKPVEQRSPTPYVPRAERFVDPGRGPRQARVVEPKRDTVTPSTDVALPEKSQRMLGALRQGEAMGLTSMPFRNIAVIAGVAPKSGTTSNRKGALVAAGLVIVRGKDIALTDAGRAYPIDVEMPPTDPEALLGYWCREIGTDKIAQILTAVVKFGPITNDALMERVGMVNSGTFSNYKGALIGRGLIEKQGDSYVATEVFRR